MQQIYDKEFIYKHETSLKYWERDAFFSFVKKMKSKELRFPCIPATQGFAMNHFRYVFVENPLDNDSLSDFAKKFKYYSETSESTGSYSSLIVFFNNIPSIESYTIENYENLFWFILSKLKHFDENQWPIEIPFDPENKDWEYCFAGEKYFMFCATPNHRHRNSRFFPYLMLAITPRWVLNEFNKNQVYSNKVKNEIRKRLSQYDTIAPHADLNQYGNEDNLEWKQYFLRDDDTSAQSCPFSSYHEKENKSTNNENR
ncbi:YqcI/YcgG family protein [Bacillus sp. UMB0893]|uniref:YqcI/YcgG family protein n=1 Tax=Bacillus sp. UMB0893 TaxID=2066053 RepID=UPI002152016C|nr:YqcI/YcgG family protein [Bacillus sp. UMB0893]